MAKCTRHERVTGMDANDTRTIPVLGLSASEVAQALGVARSFLHVMDKCGELGPQSHKLGSRRIWSAVELHHWVLHGLPPRGRWLEMWPAIRDGKQDRPGMARSGPGSGHRKRSAVCCGGGE